jgi:hypothetical protein
MSESQLKKLKAEKDRLDVEAETVKELVQVSTACQEYVFRAIPHPAIIQPSASLFYLTTIMANLNQ